jgi:hypothetical protein
MDGAAVRPAGDDPVGARRDVVAVSTIEAANYNTLHSRECSTAKLAARSNSRRWQVAFRVAEAEQ